MTTQRKNIIEQIIKVEGGYVNHPHDRGGATKYGITKKTALSFGYEGDMKNLKKETAIKIYEKSYWNVLKLNEIEFNFNMNELVETLMTIGVNQGTSQAGKYLQRCLNVLNRNYKKINVDGAIGLKTITSLRHYVNDKKRDENVLVKAIKSLQTEFYIHLAETIPNQTTFVYGQIKNRT